MIENRKRPLSPHLTIYRWPISMIMSILHRAAGIALLVGMLLMTWWIIFSIYSSLNPAIVKLKIFDYAIFKLMLFGWTFAFFHHLMNGIRHLFWDAGYGFEKETNKKSAIFVIICTIFLTFGSWVIALQLF